MGCSFLVTLQMKANFTVSSSDEMFLSHLSEAVCTIVMENTRSTYNKNSKVKNSSHDISISIHNVAEKDLVNYVMNQPEIRTLVVKGESLRSFLWESPSYKMLERICSRELVDRMHWFLPAYRLQVIFNAFKELKLEGWHEVAENRWEVLLTHFQMVHLLFLSLANLLDMLVLYCNIDVLVASSIQKSPHKLDCMKWKTIFKEKKKAADFG